MNRPGILIFLLSICFIEFSCNKEDCDHGPASSSHFIFGQFYGKCLGEGCIEMFKIEDGKLYEDDLDIYPLGDTTYQGHWNELSHEKYLLVKDLPEALPDTLRHEPGHIIGIPDGGDWGGIYVEEFVLAELYYRNNYWLLDKNEFYMPKVYNDFVNKIEEKIALINQ